MKHHWYEVALLDIIDSANDSRHMRGCIYLDYKLIVRMWQVDCVHMLNVTLRFPEALGERHIPIDFVI